MLPGPLYFSNMDLASIKEWKAVVASAALLVLTGCGALQNDVNVPLPNYPAQLVTEFYLEDGQIPRLTVTESVPYLNNNQEPTGGVIALPLPNGQRVFLPTDVTVTLILPDGRRRNLPFRPGLDTVNSKYFTHQGTEPIGARPGETFALEVRDQRGRSVTGTAKVPTHVPIDSVSWKFNDKTGDDYKAYFLTNFLDPAGVGNYYHLQLQKGKLGRRAEVDYDVQDRLNDGKSFALGTSYRFRVGDTVTSTLYHLDPAFYQFRASANEAQQANGNPFGQPSSIRSTVQGGLGVFAVLSYDRKRVIIKP